MVRDIDPDRPPDVHERRTDLSGVRALAEIRNEGYVPYLAGQVYVIGKVSVSVAGRFVRETGIKAKGTTITIPYAVAPQLAPHWANKIDVMDKESYKMFWQWLTETDLFSREGNFFFAFRRMDAPILDPIALSYKQRPNPERLDVICLSGNEFRFVPQSRYLLSTDAPRSIMFERLPPEPQIVQAAQAVLRRP